MPDSTLRGSDPPSADWTDEERLVTALGAADQNATGAFLERTHHPVFLMAGRLTRDPDQRRDWTHDTLLGVLEDLKRGRFVYTRPGSFWSWFRKRAYYRLLDACRIARRRQQREVANESTLGEHIEAPGSIVDPDRELERTELRSALEACLDALPNERHRRATWHRIVNDLPYEEIATRMEAPLNTVRAWIRRGRLALRRCLIDRLGLGLESSRGEERP